MNDTDLARISRGHQARHAMDMVADELRRQENVVVNRVMQAMRTGPLSEQEAVFAWAEMRAIRDLHQRLEKVVKAGESAGKSLADKSAL